MVKIEDIKYVKREIFKQKAIASYQHYKQTDQHVTDDEVIGWLNSWGSDKVLLVPIPHK